MEDERGKKKREYREYTDTQDVQDREMRADIVPLRIHIQVHNPCLEESIFSFKGPFPESDFSDRRLFIVSLFPDRSPTCCKRQNE